MFLWRISNHRTLDGRGGLETSARWHTLGRPVVYLAESVASALLEVLVHLELSPVGLPRLPMPMREAEVGDGEASASRCNWRTETSSNASCTGAGYPPSKPLGPRVLSRRYPAILSPGPARSTDRRPIVLKANDGLTSEAAIAKLL